MELQKYQKSHRRIIQKQFKLNMINKHQQNVYIHINECTYIQ